MTGRLDGKVALVTGAARGQGRSHCKRLAEEGAGIIAVDVCAPFDTVKSIPPSTPDDLEQTVREVEKLGGRVMSQQVDVRDLRNMEAVVRDAIAEFGHVDTVVANAGIVEFGQTLELSEAQWREVIDVNLTGVWATAKAAIPAMIEAGRGGSMTITSSAAGTQGFANLGHYVAAKHGIIGLMRTLALELGPHLIRVNTVNPGNVDTPMIQNPTARKLFVPDASDPTDDQFRNALTGVNAIPVPWIDPVDVSNAVVFLASDEARYVTGLSMAVDAGFTVK